MKTFVKCKNCEKFEEMLQSSLKQTGEAQNLVRKYAKDLEDAHKRIIELLKSKQ